MSGKNRPNTPNGRDESKDRLKARIALAVQERISPGECPSAEELAAFSEGGLDERAGERILVHLNACPDCRDAWLTVSSELELDAQNNSEASHIIDFDEAAARIKAKGHSRAGFPIGRVDLREFVSRLFRRPATAGLGLALAAGLILVIWWTSQPPPTIPPNGTQLSSQLEALIARSYGETVSKHTVIIGESLRAALVLPWEGAETGYGFSGTPPPSPEALAFAAGLWAGREQLASAKPPQPFPESLRPPSRKESAIPSAWTETQYVPYYLVGQWVILLRASCSLEKPPDASFWKLQQAILQQCAAVFSVERSIEVKFLTESFNSIRAPLGELDKNPSDLRACKTLQSEVSRLVMVLSPGQ